MREDTVMHMNHVNLPTTDIPKTRAFFETYFGMHCLFEDESGKITVLKDKADSIVTLSNLNKTEDIVYPGAFHIGFMQESRDAVDAIHARLEQDGHEVGPRKDFHGAWTFYFKPPGGTFRIEVGHQYAMG